MTTQTKRLEDFDVEVHQDHLERIVRSDPVNSIAELIWNSLDADATEIFVDFEAGPLTGLGKIRVIDNGEGINFSDVKRIFSGLGNSWKARKDKTGRGRFIHGEKGQGRFKAFGIGRDVKWKSFSQEGNKTVAFEVRGNAVNLKRFSLAILGEQLGRGTTVEIDGIEKDFRVRADQGAAEKITDIFALYLYQYPGIKLIYDGVQIDPQQAIEHVKKYPNIIGGTEGGEEFKGSLTVVEWKKKIERKLMLCMPGDFPFMSTTPSIKARGFDFTAYLTSDHFKTLEDENREELVMLDKGGIALVEAAKNVLKEHFRERETERSLDKIEEWKRAKIYPYEGDARDPIERNERSVFNVIAVNLSDYSSEFDTAPQELQETIFQLVKAAIESGPQTLPKILSKVINLPENKQKEMWELIEKTSLTSVINAAKEVTDRLDFLQALNMLIFDKEAKKQMLERKQLHRIIAEHTWIFGERFNLTADDNDLTTVLKRHLNLLGKDVVVDDPVLDTAGKRGVVDLMLSQRVPLPSDDEREHLIVELKRPSKKIDSDAVTQLTNYALAIATDDRFKLVKAKWSFVAISNDLDPIITARARSKDRPLGLVEDLTEPCSIQIWVKTWAQIIQENEHRMQFFKKQLNYKANDKYALDYLNSISEKYLPESTKKKMEASGDR
ncbi:MAG: ATP-binding protein [Alphaproteobacteria bacterium]|nr:ATP-binding protein [Alphaproteobacteria bacterium]